MTAITLNRLRVYPQLEAKDAAKVKARVILGNKGLIGSNTTSSVKDEVLKTYRTSTLTITQLNDWKFVFKKFKDAIDHHFEKRVSLLFMQSVLCHNTDYTFREGRTIHQGFSSQRLAGLPFNAAHHATIPCVYAKSKSTNNEFVFLYRSSFYDESQATYDVIKQINDADSAIDGNSINSKLRTATVEFLNLAAEGKMTPQEVAQSFIKVLKQEIDAAIIKKNAKGKKDVVDVLMRYRNKAELLFSVIDMPETVDRWLDLQIDDPILTAAGLTNRELIKRKVNGLPLIIHNERHQNKNESHIPAHFHDLYRHRLLSQFRIEDRKVVEKAIGEDFEKLEKKVDGFAYTKRTNELLDQHAGKIKKLKRELLPLISMPQSQEIDGQSLEEMFSFKKICLRPSLYRLRYRMIADDQAAQSVIKSLFENTLNEVKNGSSVHYMDDFFFYSILGKLESDDTRMIFCKLFNISHLDLTQKIREVKVNCKAHAAISKYASNLTRLSCEIDAGKLPEAELILKLKKIIKQINDSTDAKKSHVTDLCYRRLFDRAKTYTAKKKITRIIPDNLTDIDARIERLPLSDAEELIAQQSVKIGIAVQRALLEIKKLRQKTTLFKGKLLLELRKANGMKQTHFISEYNKENRKSSINNAVLIDLEKGRLSLSKETIKWASSVYGVSPTLFSPSHFAES